MILILKLCFSVLFPLSLGYLFLKLILRNLSLTHFTSVFLSYGLGTGAISLWMLCLKIFQMPISTVSVTAPLTLIFLTLFIIKLLLFKSPNETLRVWPKQSKNSLLPTNLFNTIFMYVARAYILIMIVFIFFEALFYPIESWDTFATVTFKAKALFMDNDIALKNLPRAAYPLHVPFLQVWIANNLEQWHESFIKIIFPISTLTYLMLHYDFLKTLTNRFLAHLGVLFCLSSAFFVYHSTIGYRDLTQMFFNCGTVILLILWSKDKNSKILVITGILSGIGSFVKLEGTGYLLIHGLLLLYILYEEKALTLKTKIKHLLVFLIPSIGICSFYHIYKYVNKILSLANRGAYDSSVHLGKRLLKFLEEFIWNLYFTGNWSVTWLILLATLLIYYKRLKTNKEARLVFVALSLFFGLYFYVSIFTNSFVSIAGEESYTVLSRIILHFFPLSTLLIALLLKKEQC